jgi:hypothetical protein
MNFFLVLLSQKSVGNHGGQFCVNTARQAGKSKHWLPAFSGSEASQLGGGQ